jgi:hypothetical protein
MDTDGLSQDRLVIESLFYGHRQDSPAQELYRDLEAVKHGALLQGDAFAVRQDFERLSRLSVAELAAEHARRRHRYLMHRRSMHAEPIRAAQ